MGERVIDLFEFLIKCLKVGIIPNFFIPQMNILEGISREKLDIVLRNVLDTRRIIENPYGNNLLLSGRSWIEIYHKGTGFKFTKNAGHKYFMQDINKEKSWKYFTYVIWIRFLRMQKAKRSDVKSIKQKLRTDPDIDSLENCLIKCSCSRDNQFYGPYALLKYVLIESRVESLALFRKEVTEVKEEEFDLAMGALHFDWDVRDVFFEK